MIKESNWTRNIEGLNIFLKKDGIIKDKVYYSAIINNHKDYVVQFEIENPSDIEQDGFEEVICNLYNDYMFGSVFPKYIVFCESRAYEDLDDDTRYKIYEKHMEQSITANKVIPYDWISSESIKSLWKKRINI